MGDNQEDSEATIQNIEAKLRNDTLQDLTEPVCIFFGYVSKSESSNTISKSESEVNFDKLRNHKNENVNDLVKSLRKQGLRAVSYDNKKAANPANIVVTETGVRTPFYDKEDALNNARKVCEAIINSGVAVPSSYLWGVDFKQIPPPIVGVGEKRSFSFKDIKHPDPKVVDAILLKRGESFYADMLEEAYQKSNTDVDLMRERQNLDSGNKYRIYSGKSFIVDPYYVHPYKNMESRAIIYGTPDFKTAEEFALAKWKSNKEEYRKYKHGFIHIYEGGNSRFYSDGGLELGKAQELNPKNIQKPEMAIVRRNNNYISTLIHFGDRYFEIPKDDERWNDFRELGRAGYDDPKRPHLERRIKNIYQQTESNNDKAVGYNTSGEMKRSSVDESNLAYLANVRNKLAKKIDSVVGTKIADIKLPQPIKKQEENASLMIYKMREKLKRR